MADQKKNQIIADDQKASSIAPEVPGAPVNTTKKKIRKAPKVTKKKKKKGLPVVLDVLIVVLLLAVIAGVGFGIYAIGKQYSTMYRPVQITYTLLLEDVDVTLALDESGNCVISPDSNVYLADDAGECVLGKVISADIKADSQTEDAAVLDLYLTVRATADYGHTLGYFVEQTKIAVGKSYLCRFEDLMSEALIVGLQVQE